MDNNQEDLNIWSAGITWQSSGENSVFSLPQAGNWSPNHTWGQKQTNNSNKKPTKNIKCNVTKSLLNKTQLKLEFIFSHIFVVHIIIKILVNHWVVMFPSYSTFRSIKVTLSGLNSLICWIQEDRDREGNGPLCSSPVSPAFACALSCAS